MKRTICTAVLLTAALAVRAQQPESPAAAAPEKAEGGRIYRTEVVPYDTRHDAEARNREAGRPSSRRHSWRARGSPS